MESTNPQLRQMLDSQPGMREMMRNPAFLQTMMNPQVLGMLQAMGGGGGAMGGGFPGMGGMPGAPAPAPAPAPAFGAAPGGAPDMAGLMQMMQMMGGMGGGGMGGFPGMGGMGGASAPAQPADTRPPEERFASQLTQMQDMGFTDQPQNIRALQATAGNVQFAVERILDGRV
jgi:ubiquilin